MVKKKILIFAPFYLPSVKGGGPIRSIKNLVDRLENKAEIFILTNDRDLGDEKSFENVVVNQWSSKNGINILYMNKRYINFHSLRNILKSYSFDSIYINSFFSFRFSIIPFFSWKFKIINSGKLIIAPRGEFSDGALSLKSQKKRLYIFICNLLCLYNGVSWHTTNNNEKIDLEKNIKSAKNIAVIENLTEDFSSLSYEKNIIKKKGELKIAYLARIHPMKNLYQVLIGLDKIEGDVEFNIYGPIEDKKYWNDCKDIIAKLNKNIKVNYHGQVENEKVRSIHHDNHIYILLTLGENFGHSIFEALIGGSPIIISDNTPWNNLESHNVGYSINLKNQKRIESLLQYFVNLDNIGYKKMSQAAFSYAKTISKDKVTLLRYLELFEIY